MTQHELIIMLLATMAVIWPSAAQAQSGVEGRVLLGPTCPPVRMPEPSPCAPRPYRTTIEIYRSFAMVATISTDEKGRFRAALAPGSYELHPKGGRVLPRCSPHAVVVPTGRFVRVDITCDTGIR